MISLRGLRRKTKTVKSIQQITKAMKMVSSIKLKHARERLVSARPFAEKLDTLISGLDDKLKQMLASTEELSEVFSLFRKKEYGKTLLVVVTSDRGLCGSFNSNIVRKAFEFIRSNPDIEIEMIAIGKKIKSAAAHRGMIITEELANSAGTPKYADAEKITNRLIDLYRADNVKEILFVYSTFKSIIQQPVIVKKLFPLTVEVTERKKQPDYIYEPDDSKMIEGLIPLFIKSQVYRILTDSAASEHAARMSSMENATNNAQDVIDTLTLQVNKLRQEKITSELAELSSGSL